MIWQITLKNLRIDKNPVTKWQAGDIGRTIKQALKEFDERSGEKTTYTLVVEEENNPRSKLGLPSLFGDKK